MGNFFNKQTENQEQYFYREQNIISDKKQKLVYTINVQIIRNLHNIQRFIKSDNFFITINLPYNYNNHPYKNTYKNIKSSYFPSSIKIIETNQLYALTDLPNSIKYFHLNYFCKKCINPSTQVKSYIKIPHKIIKIIIGCKKGERNNIVKLKVYNKYIKQIYFVNNNIETSEIIKFL